MGVKVITLARASLQSTACSELRGFVTCSCLVIKVREVKLVFRCVVSTWRGVEEEEERKKKKKGRRTEDHILL